MENKKIKKNELLTTFIVPQVIKIYKDYMEKDAIPIFWEGSKISSKNPYIVVSQENREIFKTKDEIYKIVFTLNYSLYADTQKQAITEYENYIDVYLEKDWVHSNPALFFNDKFLLYEFIFFGENRETYTFEEIENKNGVKLNFSVDFVLIPNRENQD